jgi:hypothetical protein
LINLRHTATPSRTYRARMRCVECGTHKALEERGWVTVLSPSGAVRIHYCPGCMSDLVSRSTVADEVDDYAEDELS